MKTILIVDDEYDILSTLEILLNLEGYSVKTAFNGNDALKILDEGTLPDLILSDLMMPVVDGYELVKRVRAESKLKLIPIILMSAAKLDENRLSKSDYSTFVRKPFDLDRILESICNALVGHGQGRK